MSEQADLENMAGQVYECVRCGEKIQGEEFAMRNRIACPHCGYRIIKKIRPPVVKRIRTGTK